MKKIYSYISLVALAAFSAGCAKELVNPEDQLTDSNKQEELVSGELTVQLSVPASAQTKTVLGVKNGDSYPVYWSPEDVVTLNGTAATEFTPSDDNRSATAKFKLASLKAPYNFLYGGVSGTSDQVSFPATQNYVADGFDPAAMPMYASLASRTDNVTFSHVGSLLRFSFTGTNKLSSITLTAADNSKSLSGNFTIGSNNGVLNGTLTPVSGNASLLYSFGEDKQLSQTPFVFYIAVPAGSYPGGIVLDVIDNEAGHMIVKVMESNETIAAGKVREFENVVYEPEKEANLILINSDATLQQFATRVAAGEIYLNARVAANFTATSAWTPVADYKGIFDGNGKTISGLTQPLFNNLGGVIRNLTLNSNITATAADDTNWGIFTKTLVPSAEVDDVAGLYNCTAKGSLTFTPSAALAKDSQIGGLVGNNRGGTVSSCTNEATVTMGESGDTHSSQVSLGGVVGRTQKGGDLSTQGDISNCTNNGSVVCNAKLSKNIYIGGVLGFQVEKKEYISGCVNNGLVKLGSTFSTSESIQLGGVIGLGKGTIESCSNSSSAEITTEAGSTGGNASDYYIGVGGVVGRISREDGTYSGLTNAGTINFNTTGEDAWIGGIVGRFNEGAGMSGATNSGSINCSAVTDCYTYIGGIAARITKPLTDCHSTGGTITYTGANTKATLYIGGITGYTNAAIEISNCSSAMTLNIGGAFDSSSDGYFGTGGVVGNIANDEATLVNCSNTGDINWSQQISAKGYSFLGGVAGRSQGVISGCSNSGTVTFSGKNSAQNPYIGGIVGTNSNVSGDRILNCTNSGNIVINTSTQSNKYIFVGGIAGRGYGNTVATNSGKIDVVQLKCTRLNLGGLIGESNGTISAGSKNLAEGDITVTGLTISGDYIRLGGVAGINLGTVTADNAGDVILTDEATSKKSIFIGGVVGRGEAPIEGCTNTGNVSNGCSMTTAESYTQVGGVVGYNNGDSPLSDCHNTGAVSNSGNSTGFLYVGGVTSESDSDIENSTNTGSVNNSGESGGSYSDGKKCHNTSVGGVSGVCSAITVTACYNTGAVSNTAYAGGGIFVGGVVGKSSNGTYVTCYNTGEVSNSGKAYDSLVCCDVAIGGFAGYLTGNANTLTGTETAYNYNSGAVSETSESGYLGVGGCVGFVDSDGSGLSYLKNLADGVITVSDNTRERIFTGGVLGCCYAEMTMDYASNAALLKFRNLTISNHVLIGGVLGGFYSKNKDDSFKSYHMTLTGLTNSGKIDCPDSGSKSGNMLASKTENKTWSYVGGISGVGDSYEKTFTNCTNTGEIVLYNNLYTRLGGVLGYTNVNPTGCINRGDIRYYRRKNANTYGSGVVGGVVGYMNVPTVENLTNDAIVNSNGSSPNCATGGLIGLVGDNTTAFLNCKVGSTNILGSTKGSWVNNGNGGSGVFCSDQTANTFDFTGCVIKTGTVCQGMTVTSDNLSSAVVGRRLASGITNPPTFVDSF